MHPNLWHQKIINLDYSRHLPDESARSFWYLVFWLLYISEGREEA
jgi:hypothetical protein